MRTTDTRGEGWWYDQRRERYTAIHDHAIDARANPKRYRLTDEMLARADLTDPALATTEPGRDRLIPLVCSRGFIRVRLSRGYLGWQFMGEPRGPLKALQRFARRLEVGPIVSVTFTSFGFGEICIGLGALLYETKPATDFLKLWDQAQEAATWRQDLKATGSTDTPAPDTPSRTMRATSSRTPAGTG